MEFYLTFFECLLATIAILVVVIYYKKNSTDSRYPPGPKSVPLLGNVLQIGSDPLRVFQKWADEYGPIYSIRMGTQNTIILSDPKLVKELFSHTNSTGRPANPITHYIGGGNGVATRKAHNGNLNVALC
ncbi:Cytochrome P450 83A1, partial [Orchesella cincta]